MEDQSLSVYRGQSVKGIGEGPGEKVSHGEQYLAAAPPLYDKQVLAAIRPWMTLSLDPLDYRSLGERIESWSCFGLGEHCFVVRLAPAGKYDDRTAYFSHGRAWKVDLLANGFDPGAYMGDSSAFDAPWGDAEPACTALTRPPGLTRMEQVAEQRQAACQLLAHLLEAVIAGRSLLLAAPLPSFAQGACLHALISFARAALPEVLKKGCRIRIYTRRIKLFLEQLGCHLVAVPQDEAEEFSSDQPQLTVLDSSGRLLRGQPPSDQALLYAQKVTQMACRQPANLLLFSSRADQILDSQDAFRPECFSSLAQLYAVCDPDPSRRQQFILQSLDGDPGSRWAKHLQPADLFDLSPEALCRILEAGLLKPSWGQLQQLACQALLDPGFPPPKRQEALSLLERGLDAALQRSPRGHINLNGLSELAGRKLISGRQAGAASFQAPLEALSALPDPSPLLGAEIESGLFAQRGLGEQELTRLAAHPQAVGALVHAVLGGRLSSHWIPGFLKQAPWPAVLAFAHRLLADPASLPDHRQSYEAALERLLECPQLPASLHPILSAATQALDPIERFATGLKLVELRCRSADPGWKAPLQTLWLRLPEVKDRSLRRWLVEMALCDEWQSLRPTFLYVKEKGSLTLDSGWLEDVADQIAACDEVVSHLSPAWLGRLAACLPAPGSEDPRERLVAAIDAIAEKDVGNLPGVVLEVQQSGFWTGWATRSRLPEVLKRRCALAWLKGAWKASPDEVPVIEEWDAALLWVGGEPFSTQEIEEMASGWGSGRPWAGFFQYQQMQDLARCCSGLDALASLCELVGLDEQPFPMGSSAAEALLSASAFKDCGLPDDFLDHLLGRGPDSGLVLDEQALGRLRSVEQTMAEGRRANLCRALRRGAVEQLGRRFLQAIRTALWLGFDSDLEFRSAWAASLAAHVEQGKPLDRQGLKLLDEWLYAHPQPAPAGRFDQAARRLAEQGFHNLAAFLWPQARQASLLQRAAQALNHPDGADELCWPQLLSLASNGEVAHPVSQLARQLRRSGLCHADAASGQQSWETFRQAVARHPGLLACSAKEGALLPALELARLLLNQSSPAQAALQVAEASQGNCHCESEAWWEQLFRGLPSPSLDRLLAGLAADWRSPSLQGGLEAACRALMKMDGQEIDIQGSNRNE